MQHRNSLEIRLGCIYKNEKLFVPKTLRETVIKQAHGEFDKPYKKSCPTFGGQTYTQTWNHTSDTVKTVPTLAPTLQPKSIIGHMQILGKDYIYMDWAHVPQETYICISL
eukprot:Pompholyxophrys_punicea_v1_NODE_703_length_1427_cov_13.845481.p2 type:complete len:110 gc:universal NODE_703_length_1427_cov_13.845481:589-918(+)